MSGVGSKGILPLCPIPGGAEQVDQQGYRCRCGGVPVSVSVSVSSSMAERRGPFAVEKDTDTDKDTERRGRSFSLSLSSSQSVFDGESMPSTQQTAQTPMSGVGSKGILPLCPIPGWLIAVQAPCPAQTGTVWLPLPITRF